ncbi:MAG: AAA family ATPase [Hyphomicrobiales bacterium]
MNHAGVPLSNLMLPPRGNEGPQDDLVDLEKLLAIALRQAKTVAVCVVCTIVVGLLLLATTPATYTAESRVLIDERLDRIVDETSVTTTTLLNDASLESQIQILRSNRLALSIVDALNLHKNERFLNPPKSAVSQIIGTIRAIKNTVLPSSSKIADASEADEKVADAGERQLAAYILQKSIFPQRVGRSHVINIAYSSHNSLQSKTIANAYAEAYLEDQLNANFEAREQAAVWLEGRLTELRQSSQNAALIVEQYRSEKGLTATRGELLAGQQLSDLASQLIEAKSDTARALARTRQFNQILEQGVDYAVQNAALPTEMQTDESTIGRLKTSYINVSRRESDITQQFGKDHPQAIALRDEQNQLSKEIFRELSVLATSFQNEYEVALSRETALQENIDIASGRNTEARQNEVELRKLEQRAAALSTLYNTFLTRYEQSAQESSFPVSKVRVISEAGLPRAPSGPSSKLVLGLAIVLGLMIGCCVGALNEFNERFFRTANDVRERIGAKFLGYIPAKTSLGIETLEKPGRWKRLIGFLFHKKVKRAEFQPRRLVTGLEKPGTISAETLRNTKLAADVVLRGESGVIALVSALPNEGKSTTALNFAAQLAAGGEKVLLLDCDLRNPGLTRSLNAQFEFGLIEALIEGKPWRSALMKNDARNFYFLPAVIRGQFTHSDQLLASSTMRDFLNDAKSEFSYIVVDLPPIGPVIDAAAFAPLIDALVLVVEWGKTPRKLVRSILADEPQIREKLLGVLINKVDMSQLGKFGAFGSSEKHLHRYASYYTEEIA